VENILNSSPEFKELMRRHIKEMLSYLIENDTGFFIMVKKSENLFFPKLPERIFDSLDDVVFLGVVNYSFETVRLNGDELEFKTSFGQEYFETTAIIPLLEIKSIMINQVPLLINIAEEDTKEIEQNEDETGIPAFLRDIKE
jgi:hypothetical protein